VAPWGAIGSGSSRSTRQRGGQRGYREAGEALRDLVEGEELYLGFEQVGQPSRGRYGPVSWPTIFAEDDYVNEEMTPRAGPGTG
jgi:hypothetical protein